MSIDRLFSVEEALAHLRQIDAKLAAVIARVGAYDAPRRSDPYAALVRAILFQQLAGSAANAIHDKELRKNFLKTAMLSLKRKCQ